MTSHHPNVKFWCLFASPFLIILLGFLTATVCHSFIGGWAWIPLAIVYWSLLGFAIYFFKDTRNLGDWFQKSRKSPFWITITMLIGMFPLTILMMNYHLFESAWLIFYWLVFALINPWFEEYYWRGVLFDRLLTKYPKWFVIFYTTALFVISHPLMWGVFSYASRSYHLYIYLSVAGIVWAITYLKTQSLRAIILSHFIVDIGNLTVLTFLNLYIPPTM
ncbi:CPBP family glutamic-type intramembrane protease [Lysinibacillus sp. FSL K6-0232]|uniref:CPBP family intramembrane glutamic endopeptidase n=1 Tax=Lysinibacillus sp. FSL K6-0232 TaxID=2921425 RepID=UPI0030FC19EA